MINRRGNRGFLFRRVGRVPRIMRERKNTAERAATIYFGK